MSCDKAGNVFMCVFSTGWIARLRSNSRVENIVNTMPLHPNSICVTQTGEMLVALVDVRFQNFKKCKKTYIA